MPDLQSGVYNPIGTESLSQDESESIFENKSGLAEDLKFLASMPELCDITFLVGDTREPVCAVKVIFQSSAMSSETTLT
jgi:hypothetical protein